jgi:hypothetical protein
MGYNYEDLNGKTLPAAAEHICGGYFDYIRWDNVQSLLMPENQAVLVSRGDNSYCSIENLGSKKSTAFNVSLMVNGTVVDTQTINSPASESNNTLTILAGTTPAPILATDFIATQMQVAHHLRLTLLAVYKLTYIVSLGFQQ